MYKNFTNSLGKTFTYVPKWLMVMKLTALLLFSVLLQVNANSFAQNVTLKEDNITLKKVFKEIRKQTGYDVLLFTKQLKVTSTIDADFSETPLKLVMGKILEGKSLDYTIEDRTIILKEKEHVFTENIRQYDAQKSITGKVLDVDGLPLIGASIQVKNSSMFATTDDSGQFTLSGVENGAVLIIKYVGYVEKEVAVGNQQSVTVILEPANTELEELVIVGYGTQKKVNLTGAVSTVVFDKTMTNRSLTNASQALGGTVPGIWVSQNSGSPGSDEAQIRVRGWGTFNNSNPLVLIDGVEGSISEVNPKDIESITVLKDAASSAIYGSKAANGVVLITLKSGKFNETAQVNYNGYAGVQSLGRRYSIIDNSVEYMKLWNQALANQGGSALFPDDVISDFENSNDKFKYPNTNFFDEVFKNAAITEHNVSVNGGSERNKYYVSMNYLDQDGIIRETSSNRYGLTLNTETKVKDWLTLGGRINGIKRTSKQPYDFNRILYMFSDGGYPFTAPYTADGRFGSVQAINNAGQIIVGNRNPLIETANGLNLTENMFLKMNVFADVKLTDFLTFKTNFTSQYNNSVIDRHNQIVNGYTDTGIETKNLDYNTTLQAGRNTLQNTYNTFYSSLSFSKNFAQKHDVDVIAGIQTESTVIKNSSALRTHPPKEGLTQVDAGTAGIQAEGNKVNLRMLSYFGRASYAFLNKYLLEMNLRADASSRFQDGNRWGVFPAFSAGWRLSEERFIQDLNVFSNLKLRGSWGQLGNQNIDAYWPYLTVIDQNYEVSNSFGGALASGAAVTSLVDNNISWETAVTTDIGIEAGFLKNRLTFEADYFRKTTEGIIVQLPVPLSLGGLTAPFENIGEMTNNGFEFNANYASTTPDRNKLGYTLGVNLAYISNTVTKFRENAPDQLYLVREGFSYRELYGLKAVGVYQTDNEAKEHMHANGYLPRAGELKFEDVNADGKIDFNDKMPLGNTIPKFTFGSNLGFSYKGFDLNVLLQGIADASVFVRNSWTQPLGISGGVIDTKWRDAWTPQNPSQTTPRIEITNAWRDEPSSFWVNKISFVKVKNIQLGYTFKDEIASKAGLERIYLFANAQNLGAIVSKGYQGFDPERNTFDSGGNFYPIPKVFSFGVNLNL